MFCHLRDITPVFYGYHYFNYNRRSNQYTKLDVSRSQYVYRYLYFARGIARMKVAGDIVTCTQGSVLYLIPGSYYCFLPPTEDMLTINLFFDYFPLPVNHARKGHETYCIFMQDFQDTFCSEHITFKDADILNHCHVFENVSCGKIFEEIVHQNPLCPHLDFSRQTAIAAITCSLLQGEQVKKHTCSETARHLLTYIQTNVGKDLNPQAVANAFGYHPNYANHLIKQAMGISLGEYIRKTKINHAKMLLTETDMTITQIAEELGYYDCSHFTKAFQAETGKSPGSYAWRP